MSSITEVDLLAALMEDKLPEQEDGEYSLTELMVKTGRSQNFVMERIKKLGATSRRVQGKNGKPVMAYRLQEKAG